MRTLDKIVSVQLEVMNDRSWRQEDECVLCRTVDCDVLFALLMISIIFGLLILVVVFWLKGII